MKAFRLDVTPWHEGYGIITNNFNKMGMPLIHTSYQYLQAMLAGMKYEEYLIFCEECLGAKIYRKNGAKYASIHFPITGEVNRFVDFLNEQFNKGYKS